MKKERISKQHEIEMLYEQLEVKNTMIKSYQSDVESLQEQKQKVIALIKDGRFVEALQELENETLA